MLLRLPDAKRASSFNFQFGKTLLASTESVVVLAGTDKHRTCAVRAVAANIAAAQGMGWDLGLGHLSGSRRGRARALPLVFPSNDRLAVAPARGGSPGPFHYAFVSSGGFP